MSRRIFTIALGCTLILAFVNADALLERASAQHQKVPEEPFKVVDAATGQTIPEILVIPLYSSYKGVFVAPEGPSKSTRRAYVDHPFVYRAGEPFKVKQPRAFTGLPLPPVLVGEGKDLDGILVIARGYRPLWTDDLWWSPGNPNYERKLVLGPISESEWTQLSEKELGPLLKGASRIKDSCRMWNLPERCDVKIRFDKKERELVRAFLQQAKKGE